jgi:hypothetical protein
MTSQYHTQRGDETVERECGQARARAQISKQLVYVPVSCNSARSEPRPPPFPATIPALTWERKGRTLCAYRVSADVLLSSHAEFGATVTVLCT